MKKIFATQEKTLCNSRKRVDNGQFKHAYFKVRTLNPQYRTFHS